MKKILVFLVVIFNYLNGISQNNLNDLKAQLETIDFGEKANVLLDEYCELANEENNATAIAFCHRTRGLFELNNSNTKDAFISINRAIASYKKSNNIDDLHKSYLIKARIFDNLTQKDSASYYYDIVVNKSQKPATQIESYYDYGVHFLNLNDFKMATSYLEKSMSLAQKNDDKLGVARVLYRLGNISVSMKEYSKAEEKLLESLAQLRASKARKNEIANNLFLLANTFFLQRKHNKALPYYKDALVEYKELNSLTSVGYTLSNIGACYTHLKEFKLSEKYLDSAVAIQTKLDGKKYLASTYGRLTSLAFRQKDFPKAIVNTEKSLEIFKELKNSKQVYIAYHNLGFLYDTIGQPKKGYKNMLTAFRYKDTVVKNDYHEKLATIETKYQTQQKENEILKLNNEKALQKASLIKSRYTTYGILGILFIALGSGYFYWNKRKQSHQLALLENSVKTSEAEKSRIGKELHDGIAGSIMKLVHDSETAQITFSHKLLETYNEVRSLSHQLDNTPEHGELFLDRVLDLIPESNETQKFNFNITPRHLEISEPNGTHIYRIIQELIANNIKHAKASETAINIALENNTLTFKYVDNGVGAPSLKKGKGYKNIDDRITLMKGTLKSKTDKGFAISFQIPYTA